MMMTDLRNVYVICKEVPDVNILVFLNGVQGRAETKKCTESALRGSAKRIGNPKPIKVVRYPPSTTSALCFLG